MENYNPPLRLAFDSKSISKTLNFNAEGGSISLTIVSYYKIIINGKQTETRLVAFNDNNDQPWITLTKSQTGDNLSYNLTISVAKNSGEARSGSVVLTQSVSGKTIEIVFNQAAGVTVQDYILLGPLITDLMFLATGDTKTVEVESYILWTDGSKTGALPYIGSKPSWLTVDITAKNQDVDNTKYLVKMTVAPNTGAIRNGSLYLNHPSAGGPTIEFTLSQKETDIILTFKNLPTDEAGNGSGALFKESEVPNSNSPSGFLAFVILDSTVQFTYRRSTGIQVNLSTPGETDTAYVGDTIKLYTWDSTQVKWIYQTQFILTGRDQTIL